jgi:hypothetical protein
MTLGIKVNTHGKARSLGFSLFYAMLSLGYFAGGPFVDYVRAYMPETNVTINGVQYKVSAYRLIFLVGFIQTLLSFLLISCFYSEKKHPVARPFQIGCLTMLKEIMTDCKFWLFLFFSVITIGMKMIFNMLSLLLPKILLGEFG